MSMDATLIFSTFENKKKVHIWKLEVGVGLKHFAVDVRDPS